MLRNCWRRWSGERLVSAPEGSDLLLLAVSENRFELRGLIGRQVELFAELGGFTLGVVGMVVLGRWGWGGVLLLRKGKTARENQS